MEIPEAHQVVYMMFSPRNITAWRRLRRLMKKERYDLVSCHTSLASFFTRMAMRGLKNRPKVACVAHGYLFGEESSAAKNLLFSTAERMAAPVTDLLMTTNSWDNGYAKDHKLGKQIVEVPGVGLDTHRLRPVHGEERMTLRAEWGVAEERVLFPGQVQMAPWYGAAALAVSASRSEGLPFNIMEAMYYGLPVVASQVKGYTDLLEETGAGLLYPYGDLAACDGCIQDLILDRELTARMGERGQQVVEAYTLDRVLPTVMAQYGTLLPLGQPASAEPV